MIDEKQYIDLVPIKHRKQFAQFFTPQPIADFLVRWLLQNDSLATVLEPAFGLGIFSRTLLKQRHNVAIKGFEVDPLIYDYACNNDYDTSINLILQDYMYNDWEHKYDGIICNPPYFKFHDYDNTNVIKEIEKKLRCKVTGFTNLYTLFLLKSIYQLKPNGRCAYIVPSEFLNSDYGKLVKSHLLRTRTLRHIIVFDFAENLFDNAITTSSIILCSNDNNHNTVSFSKITDLCELNKFEQISKEYYFEDLNPDIKWKEYYDSEKQNKQKYNNLIPFSSYAKVVRGIATGSNDYFTFKPSKAKEFSISNDFLLPCICKCADVKEPIFKKENFEELVKQDKKTFLFNACVNVDDKNVKKYLQLGEDEGVNNRYLTASRNPWFSLEKRPPAPIWVSVFNRTGMKFVRNEANVSNLTTFHCIYPSNNDMFHTINIDILFAYLLTDMAKSILYDNAREYGNGLVKFEPNDINKGMMVDLSFLSQQDRNEIIEMYSIYRESFDCSILDKIQDIFINRYAN